MYKDKGMLIGLLLFGCVKTTVPTQLAPALEVTQIDVSQNGKVSIFKVGDTLRPSDEIALTVTIDRPAFVYVARSTGNGPATLLYPSADTALRPTAAGNARIPETGFINLSALQPGEALCIGAGSDPPKELPTCESGGLIFGKRGSDDPPPPNKSDEQRGDPKVKTLRLPTAPQ